MKEPHIYTPAFDPGRIEPMYGSAATLLPLMTMPQPDTAERKRREMQAIPVALPPKREPACPR